MVRRRDGMMVVGPALRYLIARAATVNLPPRQYRVLLAALHYTASYSRLSDDVAVGQIAELTGLDRRHVRRALTDLERAGLLEYQHGDSPKGRARVSSRIGLPADPDRGPMPAPGQTGGPYRPSVERPGASPDADRGPVPTTTGGRYGSRPGAGTGPPSKETSEETSEEVSQDGARSARAARTPPAPTELFLELMQIALVERDLPAAEIADRWPNLTDDQVDALDQAASIAYAAACHIEAADDPDEIGRLCADAWASIAEAANLAMTRDHVEWALEQHGRPPDLIAAAATSYDRHRHGGAT